MRSRCGLLLAMLTAIATMGCDKAPTGSGGTTVAPATYGETSNVPDEARKKCRFDERLTASVGEAASHVKGGEGRRLSLVITRVRGAEAMWEGEISVIVEGELERDGTVIGDFRAQRRGLGGVAGGMGGVCKGLDAIADDLADDIATWLENPGTGSKIGAA